MKIKKIKVKTKKQLIEECKNMKDMVLIIFSDPYYSLLSECFMIRGHENGGLKKIELPGCKLTHPEYDKGNLENYDKREKLLEEKYIRWLKDIDVDFKIENW